MGKEGMAEAVLARAQRIHDLKRELADELASFELFMMSLANKQQKGKKSVTSKIMRRMATRPKRRPPTKMTDETAEKKIVKFLRTSGGGTICATAKAIHLSPARVDGICKAMEKEGVIKTATVLVRNKRGITRPFDGYQIT